MASAVESTVRQLHSWAGFEAFIDAHPEFRRVRTRVRTPQRWGSERCGGGSRERCFGTLKYEKLFLEKMPDALDLVAHAESHPASSTSDPTKPCLETGPPTFIKVGQTRTSATFNPTKVCQLLDAGRALAWLKPQLPVVRPNSKGVRSSAYNSLECGGFGFGEPTPGCLGVYVFCPVRFA